MKVKFINKQGEEISNEEVLKEGIRKGAGLVGSLLSKVAHVGGVVIEAAGPATRELMQHSGVAINELRSGTVSASKEIVAGAKEGIALAQGNAVEDTGEEVVEESTPVSSSSEEE